MNTTKPAAYAIDGAHVTAEEAARRALIELYFFIPDDALDILALDDVLAMLAGQEPVKHGEMAS